MNRIYYPDDQVPGDWVSPVLALGNFDGVHRGHIKIIDHVRRRATERQVTAAILTFDPHPPRIVRPDKAPQLLMTVEQKLSFVAGAGMDAAAVVRFTPEISRWEPEEFVHTVLVDWLHVSEVWVGANFLFGRDRSGNFSRLRSLGARYGFVVEKIDPIRYKEFVVSSTRIRRLIADGHVDEAGVLLGHHYVIEGDVVPRIRGAKADYDAILLDVDNGPEGLTRESNDRLYNRRGLSSARTALRRGGVLAIWSSANHPWFTKRIASCGLEVSEERVRARRAKGARRTIWVAVRPPR